MTPKEIKELISKFRKGSVISFYFRLRRGVYDLVVRTPSGRYLEFFLEDYFKIVHNKRLKAETAIRKELFLAKGGLD